MKSIKIVLSYIDYVPCLLLNIHIRIIKIQKAFNVIYSVFCTNQAQRWQIVGTPIVLQLEILPIHTLFCISSLVADTVTRLEVL